MRMCPQAAVAQLGLGLAKQIQILALQRIPHWMLHIWPMKEDRDQDVVMDKFQGSGKKSLKYK